MNERLIFLPNFRGYLMSSIIFLVFFTLGIYPALSEDTADQWLKESSRHFIIYYRQGTQPNYIKKVVRKAEDYYEEILDSLGFRRFDFWTWENRCKIFLYLSQDEYYNDTRQPAWSAGGVVISQREINTYAKGKDFLDSVLPHEMGHLIFREFIGRKKRIPLWLDEGIACFNEIKYKKERLETAKRIVKLNRYIPMKALNKMNNPDTILLSKIFYSQSASLVNFLITEFGDDTFFEFSRKIRDGQSWQSALKDAYGFLSPEELSQSWIKSIKNEDRNNNP